MDARYPTDEVPATPEYVREVLRETYWIDPEGFGFETTLADLVASYNDLAWPTTRLLGDILNGVFRVAIPRSEWEQTFPRLRGRTVRDVCDFLAPRVTRPAVRPWRHAGGECVPAGAFLTVRSFLAGRGIDPAAITPSARLDAVPFPDLEELGWWVTRAAPGRLPPPGQRQSLGHQLLGCLAAAWLLVGTILGCVVLGLAAAAGEAVGVTVGTGMLAASAGCVWLLRRVSRPPFVRTEWGEFRTFRDLAYALAGQQPRRRIQPSA